MADRKKTTLAEAASRDLGEKKKKFSPNHGKAKDGTDYDYKSAESAGMKRAPNGHMGTRNPETGQILKSRGHETWDLGVQGETEAGYQMYKGKDGKYYSKESKDKSRVNNSLFQGSNPAYVGKKSKKK